MLHYIYEESYSYGIVRFHEIEYSFCTIREVVRNTGVVVQFKKFFHKIKITDLKLEPLHARRRMYYSSFPARRDFPPRILVSKSYRNIVEISENEFQKCLS